MNGKTPQRMELCPVYRVNIVHCKEVVLAYSELQAEEDHTGDPEWAEAPQVSMAFQ
jgi:hypothetical protein